MGWMITFWVAVFVLGGVNEYFARARLARRPPYQWAENLRVIE